MKAKPNTPDSVIADLTPKQVRALSLLAAGKTGVQVAKALKVNAATVSQWLNHDPGFAKALDALRWESLRAADAELQAAASEAVAELRKLLKNGKSEQVRLRAAEFILTAVGLKQGKDSYRELAPPKPTKPPEGRRYDLDKVLEGLGVALPDLHA
jgi:predicted transcriptional regulator